MAGEVVHDIRPRQPRGPQLLAGKQPELLVPPLRSGLRRIAVYREDLGTHRVGEFDRRRVAIPAHGSEATIASRKKPQLRKGPDFVGADRGEGTSRSTQLKHVPPGDIEC